MHSSFLFILLLINFQVDAKNSCNDECSTKTYCISSDGSGVCSNNNLVTAKFAVVPDFGNYDYLQLTLTGYNITSDAEKTLKLSFDRSGNPINRYTCYKSSNGSFGARFDRTPLSLTTGSSYYTDGILNCTWTFNYYDIIWPLGANLFDDISQSITLYHDSQKVLVAPDTSQLPIYHARYLQCCNKVHGNGAFSLTFDQTDKQIRYRLYNWEYNKEMTITLTRQDGIKLKFNVHLYENVIRASIFINPYQSNNGQVMKPFVFYGEMCSWTTPFILGNTEVSFDASTSVFDLIVEVDDVIVYDEKNVELKS